MCCFAREVQDVSDTQIFARMSEAGKQFLVYRMRYQSKTLNAMILPLPVALPSSEDHVRFIALDKYEHFFDDLNRGFPYPPPPKSVAPPAPSRAADEAPTLKVEEVGEYVASFVPTLDDFGRLDPQFVIPKETWKKLPEYDDYGFAVFQLKSLSGRPHPMAFEFQTRWADQVFFPTVHIHDGEVHETEHFDHTLYLQNPAWDSIVRPFANPEYRDPTTSFVRSKGLAQTFCDIRRAKGIIAEDQLVHRQRLIGNLKNRDYVYSLRATKPVGTLVPAFPETLLGSAATGALAGLGWLINRRSKLARGE